MNIFERHPKSILTAVVVGLLLISLALTEGFLSTLDTKQSVHKSSPKPERYIRLREWQPSVDYVAVPPAIRHRNPGGQVFDEYALSIDKNGFIEPSPTDAEAAATIVFLGGSTTECMFVQPKLRFPYLAGKLLGERLGTRINGINGGKSGNNTMHSLFALSAKVIPMRPDMVVLMHNVNDLAVLARGESYWPDSGTFGHVRTMRRDIESIVRNLRDLLIPHSYRAIRRGLRSISFDFVTNANATSGKKPQPNIEKMADDYESALTQFVHTVRAWKIQPVLMTQVLIDRQEVAKPRKDDGGDYLAERKLRKRGFTRHSFASNQAYFNAIIRDVARREGALLIDLAAASKWTANDLYDQLHFTDAGSTRAAAIIAETLAPVVAGTIAARPTCAQGQTSC